MALSTLVSLLAHGTAVAVLSSWASDSRGLRAVNGDPDTLSPESAPERRNDELTLGSPTSQATSITWIGYDEYQRHVATTKSLTDQPELRMDDPGGPAGSSGQGAEAARAEAGAGPPPVPTAEAETQTPAAAEPAVVVDEALRPAVLPREPGIAPSSAPSGAPAVVTAPAESKPRDPQRVVGAGQAAPARLIGTVPPPDERAEKVAMATQASRLVEPVARPTAASPAKSLSPARSPQKPPPLETPMDQPGGGSPPGGEDARGNRADRESVASAVITADKDDLGKPLAARGLEIKTVRPRFTQYTRLTAAPRDPVLRVYFDRNGKVQKVEVLRSSGIPDVDRPVLDAIYQWRAVGEQLGSLREGDPPATLPVEFKILL